MRLGLGFAGFVAVGEETKNAYGLRKGLMLEKFVGLGLENYFARDTLRNMLGLCNCREGDRHKRGVPGT